MVELVGILDLNPNNFGEGKRYPTPQDAIARAEEMFTQGASMVDVGAESTGPDATSQTSDQEWERLEPVLQSLVPRFAGKISLSSYHPLTHLRAFNIGPVIMSDVTGFHNPQMQTVAQSHGATVIVNHMPNMPLEIAHRIRPVRSVDEVQDDLLHRAGQLREQGFRQDQIILDPGIGVGKKVAVDRQLLQFGAQVPGYKVMVSYSHKGVLGSNPERVSSNIRAGKTATKFGAAYLRVHDVAEHAAALAGQLQRDPNE